MKSTALKFIGFVICFFPMVLASTGCQWDESFDNFYDVLCVMDSQNSYNDSRCFDQRHSPKSVSTKNSSNDLVGQHDKPVLPAVEIDYLMDELKGGTRTYLGTYQTNAALSTCNNDDDENLNLPFPETVVLYNNLDAKKYGATYKVVNLETESGNVIQVVKVYENFPSTVYNRFFDNNGDLSIYQICKRIKGRLYFHFDSRFEWPSLNQPIRSTSGFCYALSSHIAIHVNGEVVPCCLDKDADLSLGNVLNSSLSDILKSERAISIKRGFDKGERREDLCQRCQFIDRFQKKNFQTISSQNQSVKS